MNQKQFLDEIHDIYQSAYQLVEGKNSDYAQDTDPFKNFREAAQVAGTGVEQAILVRIGDKLSRIKNLTEKEAAMPDEKLEDTLLDAINYLAILKVWREQERMMEK